MANPCVGFLLRCYSEPNLSVNARDAMPDGGSLRITVDAVDAASADMPTNTAAGPPGMDLRPGRYVRFRVADTGHGMDADTLKRAVEPFFSTKGVGRGTGLGLSMVHGLAAQSGGAFALDSAPGEGTTATIWLPVAHAAAAAAAARPEEDAPVAPRPARVLLVDDEELVRWGTAEALREMGYEVVEASGGIEALEQLRDGLKPDILITDQMMPGMSGTMLAAQARELQPGLPVLLITGYANLPPEQTMGLDVLAKPFREAELAAHVADLLDASAEPAQHASRQTISSNPM